MGKNNKKRDEYDDKEDVADGHGYDGGESGRGNLHGNMIDGRNFGSHGTSGVQKDPEFDTYIRRIEDLENLLISSQKAMKSVRSFYSQHKRQVQEVIQTQQQLGEMTSRCKQYRITISNLNDVRKDKENELDGKMLAVEEERKVVAKEREAASKYKKELDDERRKLEERAKLLAAEQHRKLQEQKEKLDKEKNEQFAKRKEALEKEARKQKEAWEKETRERQDADRKNIADLEDKNDNLLQELQQEKKRLKEVERRCKDAEKLKGIYEKEAEDAKKELQLAKNEFRLNSETTDFYKAEFLKIYKRIQDISSGNIKGFYDEDLNAVHDKIENIDDEFTYVPISTSDVSRKLCVAHAQRVISTQLQEIIWQPFTSEITFEDQRFRSILTRISVQLANSAEEGSGGFRASRVCTALTTRGLKLLSKSANRAESFANKVMGVLSLLVKPELHSKLRKDLIDLATAAVSLWDIAQNDEREFRVHPDLQIADFEVASLEGWHEENIRPPNSDDEVVLLFPRITARSIPPVAGTQPVGPPGTWIESEPDSHIEEICIYRGAGLPDWSKLVADGEEEEDERKQIQESKEVEEKKRKLAEEMKSLENLEKPKRKISQSRRDSLIGVGPSSVHQSTTLINRGVGKTPEN